MRFLPLLILLMAAAIAPVAAQQEATLPDGKKVILRPDGTWVLKATTKADAQKSNPNDCSTWTMTNTDKVTGETNASGKPGFIISNDGGKTGFAILTMKASRSVILNFTVAERGAGCIDEGAKINVLFRDGSRMEIRTNSKFNCDGSATIYFRGMFGHEDELEQLKSKPVETVRIWTYKSFVERDFTPDQSQRLMGELTCLDGK